MAGTLVVIAPNGAETRTQYPGREPDLATIQSAVGGFAARVRCYLAGVERIAYVNEEGLPLRLAPNPTASLLVHRFGSGPIVGSMAIVVPR
jgi:hypothetical protein